MNRCIVGDCRDSMRNLVADGVRVNLVVTSPPYFGSGTVGEVAQALGRAWLGCDISTDYEPLQRDRTAQQGLALA